MKLLVFWLTHPRQYFKFLRAMYFHNDMDEMRRIVVENQATGWFDHR